MSMNTEKYKKPDADTFRRLVRAKGGNLSKVAEALRCSRVAIWRWMKEDQEFNEIVKDERTQLFDDCLATARTVAMGLPAYEMVEENGKQVRRFAGWIERPDANMLRYFMSTLGKMEGFGESPVNEDGTVKEGVSIKAWIVKQNEGDTAE